MAGLNLFRAGLRFGGGRFVLIRLLGRGGMGEVWLAHDERLEEQVALKFLSAEVREKPAMLEHLRREVARSHRLTHPNIVRLHDFHELPGEPAFIAMEYIDGGSLNAFRSERADKVLSWEYLRRPLAHLCAALNYAHAENIIHRDLKPDNLLMDNRGRLKLTDFGVAAMASDLAQSASMRGGGTLHYMSPQQVEGRHPQVTDDIYSLGASLYELLTSQPPFLEGDIREQVLHAAPEPLQQKLATLGIENEIPFEVAAMIMSCLAKDPEQRPQSAQNIAEWLALNDDAMNPVEAAVEIPVEQAADEQPVEEVLPDRVGRKLFWSVGIASIFLVLGGGGLWRIHSVRKAAAAIPANKWPAGERWTNSLGMIFVPVPECEAMFCIWKTRVQDYQVMVETTRHKWKKPSFEQGPTHPAVNVKWADAANFCDWLTALERGLGIINSNQFYRLPSDEEWSLAVGLGHEEGDTPQEKDGRIEGVYPWGKEWPPPRGAGNFDPKLKVDDYEHTSPVGSFKPNAYGLYDLGGNAREWCGDLYAPDSRRRVVRGSSWFDTPAATLQSSRRALTPVERHDNRYDYFGFRCVLVTGAPKASTPPTADPSATTKITMVAGLEEPSSERPASPSTSPANALSKEEIAAGWKLLFDGRSTTGWRGYKMTGFPTQGWHIADGCLVNPKSNGRPNGSGGDLVTVQKFVNFEFRFEWRISVGGNSGVQYFFDENRGRTPVPMYGGDTGNSPMGFEYQILDDPNYERELKNGPKHLTAALYMLVAPTNKQLRPAGEFNEGRIVVNGNHVEHWLNGTQVLECELGSRELLDAIATTKFKWIPNLGKKFASQIALQDHGDEVAFRNLKIRELKPGKEN
jgi:serine/threonine protein kinase